MGTKNPDTLTFQNPYKIKNILVSQPKPVSSGSPYFKLAETYGVDLDFRKFVKVVPVSRNEFLKHKADLSTFTAIIFTSRSSIDHFFTLCRDIKIDISPDTKYFCVTEHIAHYLQKYISYKKRKVFFGKRTTQDMVPLFKNHSGENFLFPRSEMGNVHIYEALKAQKSSLYEIVVCRTIPDDLSDLKITNYDLVTFFSPSDVTSYLTHFENDDHSKKIFASFGANTTKLLKEKGFEVAIEAPTIDAPSMAKALEIFIEGLR